MSSENESAEGGNKAIFAALAANLSIAVTKFIAWMLTGMSSMLAEAIHSVADSGNQILLLVGGKRARKDADEFHPFGYARERYVAGFVVSIVIFSVGGMFSLYEAYEKYHEMSLPDAPHPGTHEKWWWVPIVVLIASILMEGRSLMTAVNEAKKEKGDQSWGSFLRNAKSPELPVLLCEDSAAVAGLTFALFGVSLAVFTENGVWDAVGAGLIGLLLIAVAAFLFRETRSLLLGEAARPETVREIRSAIESADGIERVIHLKTSHLGPNELMVAAKIAIDPQARGEEIVRSIDTAQQAARRVDPDLQMLVYLEPDIDTGGDASGGIGHVTSAQRENAPGEWHVYRSLSDMVWPSPCPRFAAGRGLAALRLPVAGPGGRRGNRGSITPGRASCVGGRRCCWRCWGLVWSLWFWGG